MVFEIWIKTRSAAVPAASSNKFKRWAVIVGFLVLFLNANGEEHWTGVPFAYDTPGNSGVGTRSRHSDPHFVDYDSYSIHCEKARLRIGLRDLLHPCKLRQVAIHEAFLRKHGCTRLSFQLLHKLDQP